MAEIMAEYVKVIWPLDPPPDSDPRWTKYYVGRRTESGSIIILIGPIPQDEVTALLADPAEIERRCMRQVEDEQYRAANAGPNLAAAAIVEKQLSRHITARRRKPPPPPPNADDSIFKEQHERNPTDRSALVGR
jgi:hypothetical protein